MIRFGRIAGQVAVLVALSCATAFAQGLPTVYRGATLPNPEFDAASAIRVLPNGDVVELAGSFLPTVPAAFTDVLTHTPAARTVRLESPGGNVNAALAVAQIIRAHGLDTYVGRLCTSACTLAFLGGHRRFLAVSARLGFHQASLPNAAPERFDAYLRAAYMRFNVPPTFINHVLQTPPQSIWFPTRDELVGAGFVTDTAPDAIAVTDDPVSVTWGDSMKLMRWASDGTLTQFAEALSALLSQLQRQGGEVCWGFMHRVPTDLNAMINRETMVAMIAALNHVRDDVSHAPSTGIESEERARLIAALIGSLHVEIQRSAEEALRASGAHGPYCRSMIVMMNAALALPSEDRGPTLRALLTEG